MQFNGKVQGEGGLDLSSESDRVLMAQMVIKMADINSPCKPYDLHRQWTDRICAEFYAQVRSHFAFKLINCIHISCKFTFRHFELRIHPLHDKRAYCLAPFQLFDYDIEYSIIFGIIFSAFP